MKKHLLFSAAALSLASFSASAQNFTLFEDVLFEKASEDGRYFVSTEMGTMFFYDALTETYDFFECGEDGVSPYYSYGIGNVFSQDGTMVGNIDFATPAYLKDGEWHELPIAEADGIPGKNNSADGITPDGKRICGGIAPAAMGIDANDVMLAPVYWEMDANGQYGMYHKLPYPEKDFTGRTPQYVTARYISDDGKTITGQVIDWSGFFPMPIVYHEQANGEWTYELFAQELVYDVNAVFPDYPSYEPTYPEAETFMNDEEYAAYQTAVETYNEELMNFWMGLTNIYPEYPEYANYMGEETAAAYNEAMSIYRTEYAAYQDSVDVFNAVYFDPNVVYNTNFEFNNLAMSHDGKYYASTLHALVEDGEDFDPWGGPMTTSSVYRFDLTNGYSYEVSDIDDALVTSIMNDGTVLMASPANDMLRSTYVMPAGTTACTSLVDYVQAKSTAAAECLTDYLTFQTAEMDWETWETIPGEEGVFTGSASSNGAGNVFFGWLVNNFYGVDWFYLSYSLSFDATTGIVKVNTEGSNAAITGITVTDAAGVQVATSSDNTLDVIKNLGKGIYFVTATAADGTQMTQKVIRH